MENKIWGYRRENGRVGIRNHVVIMPVDDISNAAAEAVAKIVPGTLAIPHAYGRLQYGPDLDLFFKTIIGNCSNPNVAAVVVIGIEPNWTNRIVEEVQKTGKPVAGFSIERYGDLSTIEKAARTAQKFLQNASEIRREPVELSEILVSIKCGESDTTTGLGSCPTVGNVVDRLIDEGGTVLFGETSELTGGEHIIAERCATPEVKQKFLSLYQNYVEEIASKGVDLLGSQPTEGNIRGGLTTIEEKALGNIEKTGTKPVVDALGPAEAPVKAGLNFMDTSSAAAECITLMAAGGAVVHFFPTGQGNIIGHPIVPVIKLSANPITVSTMSEHIDVDVTGLLKREYNLQQAGDLLLDILIRTINGRLTAAETLGHREFVLTKLYRSA
ncbi:UxaA family hydrolase [Aeribacillus pallidus]|jgi:Altronate dehydratase|uniref:D-galactarate dehydratase n=1 Tax=Aeribacillus pallidus TaxID=33936 RepID=A0A165XEE0_9BACI|nr:UxaA family hydrolase [Aeribacillus pallidus]KZN95935.1 D-galactarate dehydratase [Aeribacillus pallidus]REJ23201.1 MAG: D-galactarate dehydratase [Bacillaceae bacterium]